jgi:3-oxoadipate enol-lactonase
MPTRLPRLPDASGAHLKMPREALRRRRDTPAAQAALASTCAGPSSRWPDRPPMPAFLARDDAVLHHAFAPGTGRAVVFLNSLGTDFRIWDAVVDALPAGTPVLRMDKRGHGLSTGTATTIAALADDAAALMDHHRLAGAVVCGVSVGGLIAQALAARRPDLAHALVLSNTGLRIGDPALWEERIASVLADGLEAMADGVMERWFSPAFRAGRPAELAGWRAMLARQSPRGYAAVCAVLRDADLTADAHRLAQPALCLAGTRDGATPPALLRTLAAALPAGRYREIAEVGHLPGIEAPEAVAAAVVEMGGGAA